MKLRVWLVAGLLLAGCAQQPGHGRLGVYRVPSLPPVATPHVQGDVLAPVCPPAAVAQAQWLGRNLARVRLGMSRAQVAKVVGEAAYVRTVDLKDGTPLAVLFYHTPQTICRVPDSSEALMPMVFGRDRLQGYGAKYYRNFVVPRLP